MPKPDEMSDRAYEVLRTFKDATAKLAKESLPDDMNWMESEHPTAEELDAATNKSLARLWQCSEEDCDQVCYGLYHIYGPAAPAVIAGIAMGIEFDRRNNNWAQDAKEAS